MQALASGGPTRTVRGIPTEVFLDRGDGMPDECALSLDDLTAVPKAWLTSRSRTSHSNDSRRSAGRSPSRRTVVREAELCAWNALAAQLIAHAEPDLVAVSFLDALDQPHAYLLRDPDRGPVLRIGVGSHHLGAQRLERIVDERPDRLRRVPSPLERRRDRIADLDHSLLAGGAEPDVTDQPATL